MYNAMRKHREEILALIEADQKRLKEYPEGHLLIAKDRQYLKWFHKKADGTTIYLPKSEKNQAKILAEKHLIETRLKANLDELEATEKYLKMSIDSTMAVSDLLAPDSKYSDLLCDKYKTNLSILSEWEDAVFDTNTGYTEHLTIYSPTGNVVRSKSEMMIDMYLADHNAVYRYESKLELADGSFLFPDFTVLQKNGSKKYWEHCGRMDSPQYVDQFLKKIDVYEKNGIYVNESLFLTFETQSAPLQMSDIVHIFSKISG